jgi:Na+-driven multidrug efflux pump
MVATKLGGGRWRGARHSTRVALCLSAGVMVVSSTVIAAGSGLWPRLFTHDTQARSARGVQSRPGARPCVHACTDVQTRCCP